LFLQTEDLGEEPGTDSWYREDGFGSTF